MFETAEQTTVAKTQTQLQPDMTICQADYPLDWFQPAFVPYAQEYQALPNRQFKTIVNWMRPYLKKAQDHFGDSLLLLAHYYMGGTIVKLIEEFGGLIGDSYQLALMSEKHLEKKIIVESAVHFMAETISILAHDSQRVYITNPKSGCTMEMFAKDFMVEPAFLDLNERYGQDNILPICYMNTSGRIKAMTGRQGGAVCTSSNVKKIFQWGLAQNKKILFIPDQYMGENVAGWLGILPEEIAYWPAGSSGANYNLFAQDAETLARFDNAKLILFASHCGVHSYFQPEMVHYWRRQGYNVVVHPESRKPVVDAADCCGSTAFIWDHVMRDRANTKKYAIGTENHMVENLKQQSQAQGIQVVNLGSAKIIDKPVMGCGCATMSRNDPPHLVALLDLLRKGEDLDYNQVKPGDVVNEFTGTRARLSVSEQEQLIIDAKRALQNMIRITESV